MRRALLIAVLALGCLGLWFLPGPRQLAENRGRTVCAEIVETDDTGIALHGLVEFGTQRLKVRFADGSVHDAANELRAQMELDKKFKVGETALVVVPSQIREGDVLIARDHWRMGWGFVFFGAFCLLLCVFGGWTGAKALFSFVFSCFAVWKLLIPLVLD